MIYSIALLIEYTWELLAYEYATISKYVDHSPEDSSSRYRTGLWNHATISRFKFSPLADPQQYGCISCHDCADIRQCPHDEA